MLHRSIIKHITTLRSVCLMAVMLTFLGACTSERPAVTATSSIQDSAPLSPPTNIHTTPDAIPQIEPKSAYGNPAFYEVFGKRYYVQNTSVGYKEQGYASWYGTKFHGNRTSSGEPYDMYLMTAAHTSLPLPTYARVTRMDTGDAIIVKINDRGPFHDDRIIDLSYAAAARLGILQEGTGWVEVEALNPANWSSPTQQVALMTTQALASAPATTDVNHQFFLQVGAFSNMQYASALVDTLQPFAQHNIMIEAATPNIQPFYRVRIGPFDDVGTAQYLAQEIAQTTPHDTPLIILE